MKLLFVTPPMGNWAPWGDRHLAVNSLHSQVAAFIREKKAADVAVLDCRALGMDDEQMLQELGRRRPDVVFFGSVIPAAGGAAQLNRFHAAMKRIKESYPKTVTVGGGLMYTAVPQQIMKDNPQLDFAIVGVFGDNEYTLWELLEELKRPSPNFDGITGLTHRKGDEIVLNPARPLIQDLDELPMANLKQSLKTGQPLSRMDTGGELQVWEKLVIGIIPIAEPVAKALCDVLGIGVTRKGLRILDIAGGSSIFGMTILARDPSAQVTQLDWPNVNAVAKKLNRERGLEGKIRFIDGEHRSAAIETNYYDLILASNFCRFESPKGNRELFQKAYAALKPGGSLVVNDFLPNEERTGPTFALRFSVYTLTHTPEGECWTLSQYSDWLKAVGFNSIQTHSDIPKTLPGTTLIVANK